MSIVSPALIALNEYCQFTYVIAFMVKCHWTYLTLLYLWSEQPIEGLLNSEAVMSSTHCTAPM